MSGKYYVYLFCDANDSILYVGITNCISRRIKVQHFSRHGHLSYECYRRTEKVLYMECPSETDAALRERYLINKESPEFNTKMNLNHAIDFKIDNWDWLLFSFDRNAIPPLSTFFDECNLTASMEAHSDILGFSDEVETFDVVPCVSTQLFPDNYNYNDDLNYHILEAVCINSSVRLFLEPFLDFLNLASSTYLKLSDISEYLDNGIFKPKDISVVKDKHLITLTLWEEIKEELPDKIILVSLQSAINFLDKVEISEIGTRQRDELKENFRFYDSLNNE